MRYYLILFLISISTISYSQKNINVVIVVDGVVNANISSLKLKSITSDNKESIYDLDYTIGDLKIKESDYSSLVSNDVKSVSLQFSYTEICNSDIEYYHYNIDDFKMSWLDSYYFVLYIYNTNKRKYKKIYDPIPNKEFTYEYDSPEGSMRRVTKRKRKKCN